MTALRVVIADDQGIVRGGLRMILEAARIDVVGEAADGKGGRRYREPPQAGRRRDGHPDARYWTASKPPDRSRVVDHPSTKILVLTTYGADEYVYEALRAGAAGFLLKMDSPPAFPVDAVRPGRRRRGTARAGDHPPHDQSVHRRPPPQSRAPAALGPADHRERDVLALLARGLSNAEIARALYVGGGTR